MRFKAAILQFGVMMAAVVSMVTSGLAQDRVVQLVGLGDSLMAGYQLPDQDSLPAQLQKALQDKGLNVVVTNAGVSGDTSAGGLSRVDWSVPDGTDGVILELGANDALRGIAPEETEKNLEAIIVRLKEKKVGILLVGMLAPPNMGDDYQQRFNPIYQKLADKHQLPLYPFILDGVITEAKLKLEDGMHPNAGGVGVITRLMLPQVEQFIGTLAAKTE
ncbi:arylesterase [Agrobacterium sp. a22-2]|uniref:arylesterase n=1 Tax=Agrobacterium sp. a22-2 TaxID=2283840 RepID=UPI001445F14E|nr:arylesterase [Agrobacterium sp. a22-2]NKN36938.1 arylesterase [Agrobacterium sp. a22-2]